MSEDEQIPIPELKLPKSSDDLLLPNNLVLQALSVYEVNSTVSRFFDECFHLACSHVHFLQAFSIRADFFLLIRKLEKKDLDLQSISDFMAVSQSAFICRVNIYNQNCS